MGNTFYSRFCETNATPPSPLCTACGCVNTVPPANSLAVECVQLKATTTTTTSNRRRHSSRRFPPPPALPFPLFSFPLPLALPPCVIPSSRPNASTVPSSRARFPFSPLSDPHATSRESTIDSCNYPYLRTRIECLFVYSSARLFDGQRRDDARTEIDLTPVIRMRACVRAVAKYRRIYDDTQMTHTHTHAGKERERETFALLNCHFRVRIRVRETTNKQMATCIRVARFCFRR